MSMDASSRHHLSTEEQQDLFRAWQITKSRIESFDQSVRDAAIFAAEMKARYSRAAGGNADNGAAIQVPNSITPERK